MNLLLLSAFLVFPMTNDISPSQNTHGARKDGLFTVTILFDNTAARNDLETGWGFSALIESPGHTVLFDTGADGAALLRNMRILGKDPSSIEAVVISHAHTDHTGGLQALLDTGIEPVVYLLEEFPPQLRGSLPRAVPVVAAAPGQEIVPGVRTTGTVGSAIPEQAVLLHTGLGTVLLTGCAHPGPVAMAEQASRLSPAPIHLVAGGFHLLEASPEQIQGVIQEFRRLGVARAGATHCTGDPAIQAFRAAYGSDFQPLGAGRSLTFPLAQGPEGRPSQDGRPGQEVRSSLGQGHPTIP